jgi:hypothetical protein
MATHALGSGTCNLPINFKVEERNLLGQLAFQQIQNGKARSVGDFIKQLILRGVEAESPEAAMRIRAIRNGITGSALLLTLFFGMARTWLGADTDDFRPPSRIVRVLPGGRCKEELA